MCTIAIVYLNFKGKNHEKIFWKEVIILFKANNIAGNKIFKPSLVTSLQPKNNCAIWHKSMLDFCKILLHHANFESNFVEFIAISFYRQLQIFINFTFAWFIRPFEIISQPWWYFVIFELQEKKSSACKKSTYAKNCSLQMLIFLPILCTKNYKWTISSVNLHIFKKISQAIDTIIQPFLGPQTF